MTRHVLLVEDNPRKDVRLTQEACRVPILRSRCTWPATARKPWRFSSVKALTLQPPSRISSCWTLASPK